MSKTTAPSWIATPAVEGKYAIPPSLYTTVIDPKDNDSADDWIPRHPEMVRLTGLHPFNVEPPLPKLVEQGFVTPSALHYVRNHGPVPKLDWGTHTITIKGLVEHPITLTMDELIALPSRTLPVTLTCAGNRRKEQNMIQQSIGFHWGAGATGCAVWKGVLLCDLLKYVGAYGPDKGAKHVIFNGSDELPNGTYGTSLTYGYAVNPSNDVMLAYEMNGERLAPDHGFPVRCLIPGMIGGRQVKWLKEIIVSEVESDSHYHYFDNRVLPTPVTSKEQSIADNWYKPHPDFIINELNINSAISHPNHGEVLELKGNKPYLLQGYCYSGGGRKVIRCEITFDNGKTWEFADIKRTETPTFYAKNWAWVHWSLPIDPVKLIGCKEVCLRGWDAAMNTQPEWPTWNLMGMMNNPWFRVRVHPTKTAEGELAVWFEHPTMPGPEGRKFGDGWKVKEGAKVAPPEAPSNGNTYSMTEVAKHNTKEDLWVVHEGKVFDVTKFVDAHPGGARILTKKGGDDISKIFNEIHSDNARKKLNEHYIGNLAGKPKL